MENQNNSARLSRGARGASTIEYGGVLTGCALVSAIAFSLAHPTLMAGISSAFSSVVSQLKGADSTAGGPSGTTGSTTGSTTGGSG